MARMTKAGKLLENLKELNEISDKLVDRVGDKRNKEWERAMTKHAEIGRKAHEKAGTDFFNKITPEQRDILDKEYNKLGGPEAYNKSEESRKKMNKFVNLYDKRMKRKAKQESFKNSKQGRTFNEDFNEVKPQVEEAINKYIAKYGDHIEIYADYRDELDEKSIQEIIENPESAYEVVDSLYFDNGYFGDEEYDYLIKEQLGLPKETVEEYFSEIYEMVQERIYISPDYSHFLNIDINVDVFPKVNRSDDMVVFGENGLESVGESVKFFLESQGHTEEEFIKFYNSLPDFENGTGKESYDTKSFFGSLVQEIDNHSNDYYAEPVLLGNINLMTLVKKDLGTITIPADCECGITDTTNGAGGPLEVDLEKPITLNKDQYEMYYYHGYKYNVDDIYGLVSSAWRADIKIEGTNESLKSRRKPIGRKMNEKHDNFHHLSKNGHLHTQEETGKILNKVNLQVEKKIDKNGETYCQASYGDKYAKGKTEQDAINNLKKLGVDFEESFKSKRKPIGRKMNETIFNKYGEPLSDEEWNKREALGMNETAYDAIAKSNKSDEEKGALRKKLRDARSAERDMADEKAYQSWVKGERKQLDTTDIRNPEYTKNATGERRTRLRSNHYGKGGWSKEKPDSKKIEGSIKRHERKLAKSESMVNEKVNRWATEGEVSDNDYLDTFEYIYSQRLNGNISDYKAKLKELQANGELKDYQAWANEFGVDPEIVRFLESKQAKSVKKSPISEDMGYIFGDVYNIRKTSRGFEGDFNVSMKTNQKIETDEFLIHSGYLGEVIVSKNIYSMNKEEDERLEQHLINAVFNKFGEEETLKYLKDLHDKELSKYKSEHPNYFSKVESKQEIKPTKKSPILEELHIMITLGDYTPWSGAVETFEKIEEAGMLEELEAMLEDMYPDGIGQTELNDLLWFDSEWVLAQLGIEEPEEDEDMEESLSETKQFYQPTARKTGLDKRAEYKKRLAVGTKYLEGIAKENGWKEYEIVEDSKEYPNGLLLVGYSDKNHEQEIDHICINLFGKDYPFGLNLKIK